MAEKTAHKQIASDLEKLEKELVGGPSAKGAGKPTGKKKGKSASRGPGIFAGLRARVARARADIREAAGGVRSADRATRRMATLFLASLIGLGLVGGYSTVRIARHFQRKPGELTESELQAKHMNEFFAKQSEENKHRASKIDIGAFTVELKPVADTRPTRGVLNMAEVELVLDCDNRETREFVEGHLAQVRDQVTGVLTAVDRGDLMTREGKKKLRKLLVDKINLWLPQGKVEDLYFTRVLLT